MLNENEINKLRNLKPSELKKYIAHLSEFYDLRNDIVLQSPWDKTPNRNVYVFFDPLDFQCPVIYVGEGLAEKRMRDHWTRDSHNPELKLWIDYWKLQNLDFKDVCLVVCSELTKLEACVLEWHLMQYFQKDNCLVNIRGFGKTLDRSDNELVKQATKFLGKSKSEVSIKKSSISNTKKRVLNLKHNGNLIKSFSDTPVSQVVKWIFEKNGDQVHEGNLVKTLVGSRTHTLGYHLESSQDDKSYNWRTTVRSRYGRMQELSVLKHLNGRKVVVVGISGVVAKHLKFNEPQMSAILNNKGKTSHSKGWSGRYLTETEKKELKKLLPYQVECIRNESDFYLGNSIFEVEKFFKTPKTSLARLVRGLQTRVVINTGDSFTAKEIWKWNLDYDSHKSFIDYFVIEVDDSILSILDAKIPNPVVKQKPSENQSTMKGVQFSKQNKTWFLNKTISGKIKRIGSSKSKELIEQIASAFERHGDYKQARKHLLKLKELSGEAETVAIKQSDVKGVNWHQPSKKWKVEYGRKSIGTSKSQEAAENARFYFEQSRDLEKTKLFLKELNRVCSKTV